jgi:hypothetical protein
MFRTIGGESDTNAETFCLEDVKKLILQFYWGLVFDTKCTPEPE